MSLIFFLITFISTNNTGGTKFEQLFVHHVGPLTLAIFSTNPNIIEKEMELGLSVLAIF